MPPIKVFGKYNKEIYFNDLYGLLEIAFFLKSCFSNLLYSYKISSGNP
jgi:hypothetical protein